MKNDSLYFESYDTNPYSTGIGSLTLEEYTFFPDSSLMIVISDGGGDAEDSWGGFSFVRYQYGSTIERLLEKGYEYSVGDSIPDVILKYELAKNSVGYPMVKLIKSRFKPNEHGPYAEDAILIKSDTSYVDLWELVKKKSTR